MYTKVHVKIKNTISQSVNIICWKESKPFFLYGIFIMNLALSSVKRFAVLRAVSSKDCSILGCDVR
jgi:hypothetical protein